ncbi:histone-lysine N-methyltransferase ash1 isoform X1 [Neodiprion pinetum]|uniref:histone-lysine N-methyltransferase ash1 isoform X1 n=1 Tax=Neodiprion pinetum TaxID=441929 RepID=UPI001EDE1CC8|nr:histone-lysine N-methyltransferase ash1 isoform X2 [Neodiprion pinetum]XP_046489203.1 histone-lysine N-methyltransferase ash1 isoform X2 [Neodiprion pinetum]XP_046489204.1 histone-lysine N-methyltransferase ash1 isoform X2 [Neodiprion pinetum]XP_046489205.1 histone-lysine N-methyltransferase ash1 isoform X2 [Neodiprion pinetum]XP_046489206.1 histone-lysine N-methyltransferase ash1 isoform X2 [Neodiprion pinetum]
MSGDSGWSAVIHRPSELELQNWNWDENDGDQERELPSTVDMDAIKGGGSWDPPNGTNGTDSVDSEDDSESEEESSAGSDGSCSFSDSNSDSEEESTAEEEEDEGEDSGSDSDCTSERSEQTFSIRETNFEQLTTIKRDDHREDSLTILGALKLKIALKASKKEDVDKPKCEKPRRPASRRPKVSSRSTKVSECSSDESETANARPVPQQQQPLQEINQEDLAAILPDQEHEDAPFDGFEDSESGRLVSKAIERMSLGADSDTSENTDQNPVPVYSSTLLQQFVEKTAMLSEPRKRRSKPLKKSNEPEYASVSNVSPDSGIQSVNNSPLHLGVSPISPPLPSQSPVQVAQSKPAVNVDRILYPPKRKPGRPAKSISTQPRGPGRPKLKPEIIEKIEKIERNESPGIKKAKEIVTNEKRMKGSSTQGNSKMSEENKDESVGKMKKSKNKRHCQDKKCTSLKTTQDRISSKSEKLHSPQDKCLNKPNKQAKNLPQCDGNTCKNVRQERSTGSSKTTSPSRQKCSSRQNQTEDKLNHSQKVSKENRADASPASRKQGTGKKLMTSAPRRVLKENKNSKKSAVNSTSSGVGHSVEMGLLMDAKMKCENPENDSKQTFKNPLQNHRRKHHHKHKRRYLVPPKTPVRIDPCVIQELEKLIEEFSKCCSLGRTTTNSMHSELPQIFRVKKITKKRKGGDVSLNDEQKLKRRLKKEKVSSGAESKNSTSTNSNSNSNEQRLPLKKRHYHVSSPHSSQSSNASCTEISNVETNSTESHIEEAIEATITRYSSSPSLNKASIPVTPKKRHRDVENVPLEKLENESFGPADDKPLNLPEIQPRRKKKILRDLRVTVTKLDTTDNYTPNEKQEKMEKNSGEKTVKQQSDKLNKNEKLQSDKLGKVDKPQSEKTEKNQLDNKNERFQLKSISNGSGFVSKNTSETLDNDNLSLDNKITTRKEFSLNVPNPVNPLAALILTKRKIRRRKAINRTGFPTLKKKKKKLPLSANGIILQNTSSITQASKFKIAREDFKSSKMEDGDSILKQAEAQDVLPILDHLKMQDVDSEKPDDTEIDIIDSEDSASLQDHPLSKNCSEKVYKGLTGQLRVRKDLVECDGSKPCDKLCPIKYEKVQDSRIYDENATLEESLERYNQSQRVAELSEENLRKLERANSQDTVKLEISGNLNNNHSHKRRRGSVSPCNLTIRNLKRLRNAGYDTESDAMPSSDVASDDHELGKHLGSSHSRKKQPRWKKRYLQAGLFSDYFKEDEPRKVLSSDNNSGKNKMVYDPAEHPHGLLPPPYHCGKFLRQRKIPFQLPYDLWWLHTHSRLPGRDLVPSWNYRKIRTNIYYDVKPTTLYEAQACECKAETGCGEDCINRMVFSECSPQLCPCAEKCRNQKIQRHEWAPGLQRFMTEDKGWGVKTQEHIRSGEFILEYVGEVVSEREFKSRMATRYANDTHHYCLHLDGGLVIDGHRMGGDGRFVNHSCEPNCEMQKWSVHGLPRMALFASRDIKSGEELTYDYNFALFNPSEGQQCRCGSNACRGVIGGKSQRVVRPVILSTSQSQSENSERRSVGRPRKNVRKSNIVHSSNSKGICKSRKLGDPSVIPTPLVKPMSHQQRCFAQQHHCFLLRNLEKVRRLKSVLNHPQAQTGKVKVNVAQNVKEKGNGDAKTQSDAFFSQLTALTNTNPRTVRTRRLAQAQDDPEVNKTAKLAKVLKDLYTLVATAKDETDQLLCAPFINSPPKRKLPEYYEKISDPIDLSTIDQCIGTGHYKTAEQFDQDMIRLFDNNVKFFGRTSEVGIAAARLRKLYLGSKLEFVDAITDAMGVPPSQGFLPPRGSTAGEEDVIRCICGLHRDEGVMIQCERCLVWQHCDCVKADTSIESYLCERCQPRPVDLEIPLEAEEEEEGKRHYVTLLRGDLQLRQGDTVYVLRDTPEKHTYKTIQKPDYEQMDIFRIERLWKNSQGERYVFGHHYLRPHETYHEPTRKFYENEVVCAPLYEAVPCELVAGRCWVLDPHTYCKGRPVGSTAEHTYVCEYRVDRAARLFTKVARARHQVCTKPYAFETFSQRMKYYRTYLPHSLEGVSANSGHKTHKDKKKNHHDTETHVKTDLNVEIMKSSNKDQHKASNRRIRQHSNDMTQIAMPSINCRQRGEQRKRLNGILVGLLQRMPNKKDPLDLSFLLERNRRNRKRPGGLNP